MSYYFNLIKSGLYVLSDRTVDFVKYYLLSDNDLDDESCKIPNRRIFPKVPYLEQLQIFFGDPTHIIDSIYLGSAFNASNYDIIKKHDIHSIINMTNELTNHYETIIDYKRYPLYDNNNDSIIDYLENTYQDIIEFQTKNPNKNILIHCFMGASRSATVVAYYLMKKYGLSVDDAILKIKEKRYIVNLTAKLYSDLHKIQRENSEVL